MFNYIRENGPNNLRSLIEKVDMCVAGYTTEEDIYGFGPYSEEAKKLHRLAYPVTIDIHRFAVKQDVINFVREKWDEIEKWRTFVNGIDSLSVPRRRKRPKAELSYFLYDNQDKSTKTLQALAKENFKIILGYEEVRTLINDEKKRRNKPLKA